MPFFDYYIMVDWSGASERKSGGADCLWIAYGRRDDPNAPYSESPCARSQAINRVHELARHASLQAGSRVLACFDFAFGYPAGFAGHLPKNGSEPRWSRIWRYLALGARDDIGTKPGRLPTNQNNRFDLANDLNELMSSDGAQGPYWSAEPNWRNGKMARSESIYIPQKLPRMFTSKCGVTIKSKRICDEVVRSDFPFRLYGTGSVGSQVLMGIPSLYFLRNHSEWIDRSAVWPFETAWPTADAASWLGDELRLVLAEIYPSVRDPLPDAILDRGQVRSMWQWARDLDQSDQFIGRFARPSQLTDEQEPVVRQEEGWILH